MTSILPVFKVLPKLRPGDKIAVVSPSFAGPAVWPAVYQLGLQRLRGMFGLEPVSYPATAKLDASTAERAADLIAAFTDPEIKGVISTIGGDDMVTYIKNLPDAPFRDNPKPFFGFSDTTHFANHLWLNGIPSFYGAALITQVAEIPHIDPFTERYLRYALYDGGEQQLTASDRFSDNVMNWGNPDRFSEEKSYLPNPGWHWDGDRNVEGLTWGGCLESIDEILRHGVRIPSLEQFEEIVMMTETYEGLPGSDYVPHVYRALGERGILARVRAVLVGRPQVPRYNSAASAEAIAQYREQETGAIA